MCPMCISSAAMLVAGTASTGGIAALAVKTVRRVLGANFTNCSVDFAKQHAPRVANPLLHQHESFPVHTKGERL